MVGFKKQSELLIDGLLSEEGWIKLNHKEWGELQTLDFDNWRDHPAFPALCRKVRNKTGCRWPDDRIYEEVVRWGRSRNKDRIPIPKVEKKQPAKAQDHDWDDRIRSYYRGVHLGGRKHLIDAHADRTFYGLQSEGYPYDRREFDRRVNNLRKQKNLN